jgi:hypothetical protein
MRNAAITFCVGIALMVGVGAVVLTGSPPRVVRVGGRVGIVGNLILHRATRQIAVCQPDETLPSHVSAIRLATLAFFGSPVRVVVYSGSLVLTEGSRGADWTGASATVPVKPVSHSTSRVTICFALAPNNEAILLWGVPTPLQRAAVFSHSPTLTEAAVASAGRTLGGRVGVEYLAGGGSSWWSRLLTVARRMGLGRAFSGTWIALFVAALMVVVGALAVRLSLRDLS